MTIISGVRKYYIVEPIENLVRGARMCLDDSARVSCLHGDCNAAVEGRALVVAVRDPGCHARERVGEFTSSLAHRTERLHSEGTN